MTSFFHSRVLLSWLLTLSVLLSVPARVVADDLKQARIVCTLLQDDPGSADILAGLKTIMPKISDDKAQHQLMAIYFLACMFNGETATAQSATSWLMKNGASSVLLQKLTVDNLSDDCPACKGEGKNGDTCSRCKGSRKCVSCKGTGKKKFGFSDDQISCSSCNETGKCVRCEGSGKEYQICLPCKGKGRRYSRNQIGESLKEMIAEFMKYSESLPANETTPTPEPPKTVPVEVVEVRPPVETPAPVEDPEKMALSRKYPDGVELELFQNAYSTSLSTANTMYRNKSLTLLDATVNEVGDDGFGGVFLIVASPDSNSSTKVYCAFPGGFGSGNEIQKGDVIILKGTCIGKQGKYLSFDNCKIIKD